MEIDSQSLLAQHIIIVGVVAIKIGWSNTPPADVLQVWNAPFVN